MKNKLNIFISQITNALHIPQYAGFLIELLSNLQITHLIFITMSYFIHDKQFVLNSLSKNLPFFTGAFPIHPSSEFHVLVSQALGIFLAYFTIHICLIIAAFLQISLYGVLNKALTKIMAGFYLLHSRIIFFPCQFFLSSLASFYSYNEYHEFYQSTGWLVTIVILSIVNFALAIPKEFFLYQTIQTKDISSTKSNIFHQLAFIYKGILLLLIIHGQNSKVLIQITSIFHFGFCSGLRTILWNKLPFYDFYFFRLILTFTAVNWSFALISIIQVFASSNAQKLTGSVNILILLLPILLVKFSSLKYREKFEKILQGEFESPEYAIHYGILVEKLSFQEKNSNLSSLGFMPDKYQVAGALASKTLLNKDGIYENIVDKLEVILNNYPKSEILLLYLADIYLNKLKNVPRFLQVFRRIQGINCSRFCERLIDDFSEKLEEIYQEDNGAISRKNVYKCFANNDLVNSIKEIILEEIGFHMKIWKNIENNEIDMKKIVDHSQTIEKIHSKITKQFAKDLSGSEQNLGQVLLLIQIIYLNNVRNQIHETQPLLKLFHLKFSAHDEIFKLKKKSFPTAFVIISLDKKRPGIILDTSGPIDAMFEVKKAAIVGQNFGCLFPSTIAKVYQGNIQEYAKNPTYKMDHKYKTYGQNSSGEIFELEAHFQLYCHRGQEIAIIVQLKKISEPQMVMIANTEGLIKDCSPCLKKTLNTQGLSMTNHRAIQDISVELDEANRAFNFAYKNQQEADKTSKELRIEEDSTRVFKGDSTLLNPRASYRSESGAFDTSRILLKPSTAKLSLFDNYSQNLETMNQLKDSEEEVKGAVKTCEEFTEGKSLMLVSQKSNLCLLRKKGPQVTVKIAPLVFNGEIYKILVLSNFKDKDFGRTSKRKPTLTFKQQQAKQEENVNGRQESEDLEDKQDIIQIAVDQNWASTSQQTSSKESFHRDIRISRTLQEISTSNNRQPGLERSLGIAYISMLFILVMSIINCVLSRDSIKDVNIGLNIVHTATKKTTFSISLWQDAIFIYLEARSPGFFDPYSLVYFQEDVVFSSKNLKKSTTELENAFSLLNVKELSQLLFEKNIKLWSSPSDPRPFYEVDNLLATDLLISKYNIFTAAYDPYGLLQKEQVPYILNNTINDYTAQSRILIQSTENYLQNLIQDSIYYSQIILAFDIVALILFGIIVFIVALVGILVYDRLFKAIVPIKKSSVIDHIASLEKVKSLLQEDFESSGFINNALGLFNDLNFHMRVKENSSQGGKGGSQRQKKISQKGKSSTRTINLHMMKLFVISITFMPLLGGLFIWSVLDSIDSFRNFKDLTNQVTSLTQATFFSYLFTSLLHYQTAVTGYPNQKALGGDIRFVFPRVLETAKDLSIELATIFSSSNNGLIDDYTLGIMQDNACPIFDDDYESNTCLVDTEKFGAKGLYALNFKYLEATKAYLEEFKNAVTFSETLEVLLRYREVVTSTIIQLQSGFATLTKYILENIGKRVERDLEKEFIALGCLGGVLGMYLMFLYWKALESFRKLDLGRRRILKVIPWKMVQENRALSWYVVKTFRKESEMIKNIL